MKKFEYDEKNEKDFEENTTLIMDALEKIRKDKTLKPFVKTICDLTGIHRNTLRNRVWPLQKLEEIKTERNLVKSKVLSKTFRNSESVLQEKLDNAQKELVYWYTLHKKLNETYKQLYNNYEKMTASRDSYQKDAEKYKKEIDELQKKLDLIMTLH